MIVIPARYFSVRFPGKPLAMIAGKPMIEWVWRSAMCVSEDVPVWVATEDERIVKVVEGFGGKAVLTSAEHVSGTDRVLEAYEKVGEGREWVVNWQGDEPLFPAEPVGKVLRELEEQSEDVRVLSFSTPFVSKEEFCSQDAVKVIQDVRGDAIYFSRHEIPYSRQPLPEVGPDESVVQKHLGLYVYHRDVLQRWSGLSRSPLEEAESLEQLRLLAHGFKIRIKSIHYEGTGVDRPDQAEWVAEVLRSRGEKR